jgi:hypothetical protein
MSEASKHIAALDRRIRDTFTPGVTTGYDADYDDSLLVVGKEIDGGRRLDHRRLKIQIKGALGEWQYDLIYCHKSARILPDAVIRGRNFDQMMEAVSGFLKVEALAA